MAVVAIIEREEAIADDTIFLRVLIRDIILGALNSKGYANNNNSYLYVQFVLIGFANRIMKEK
ncbi:hypothetical protein [Acinetobacter lactucae]|uniref:hypothetical protein n=1 Tax=Acinetobacter lactucae TaxID=1785128 RepID=UPI001428CE2A|nr:hypothetical protein [Acinetobacter lactucae]